MAIDKAKRKKAETIIYQVMDALDPSGTNSEHYKKVFSQMSDTQFEELFKNKFPLKFHVRPFEIEPTIDEIEKAAKIINIPLLEKVRQPHMYVNENGEPVQTKECMVGYVHLRKVQQFLTKKNSMSSDIAQRDMKTGLLLNYDKNGKTSDREVESLITTGLLNTADEFVGPKADSMNAKNTMYNMINNLGYVNLKDIPKDAEDSLAMNLLNTYLLGAHLNSNLVNNDYMLPYTINNKNNMISRI